MTQICLATNNKHKVHELQQLLGDSFQLTTLEAIGCNDEIEENGKTLEENSKIKAEYIFKKFGINTIADDSGLEVYALNNEPGVYSARYAGKHGDHEANMDLLLKNLESQVDRSARFRTVITMIIDGKMSQFDGKVEGEIIKTKKGNGGFGYDPIFVPKGFNLTFAEMSDQDKNQISHRGNAIKALLQHIKV